MDAAKYGFKSMIDKLQQHGVREKSAGSTFAAGMSDRLGGLGEKFGSAFGMEAVGQRLRRMRSRVQDAMNGAVDPNAKTTPYLGKWDRLSQVWLNRWTLLIFLIMARVVIESHGFDNDILDARYKVISACVKLESAGSTIISMPHYLSVGANKLTALGIESVVNGLVEGFVLLIDGIKNLLIFAIDMWKGTWECLTMAIIQGALDVAEEVVQGALDAAQLAVKGVGDVLTGLNSAVNTLINIADKVPFVHIPKIDLQGAINSVNNVNISTSSTSGPLRSLQAAKNSTPTYAQLTTMANNLIGTPFTLATRTVSDKWGNYEFNHSLLPVAPKTNVTICSDSDTIPHFFDRLTNFVDTVRVIVICLCILLALIAIAYCAWRELKTWNQAQHIELAMRQAHDMFDAVWIISNPRVAQFAFWLAPKITSDPDKQVLVRWCIAYATSTPALFVLALALSELVLTLIKLLLLSGVWSATLGLAADVGVMAGAVIGKMNDASYLWGNTTNDVILGVQSGLNNDLFSGVKVVTTAVNSTLTTILTEVTTVLHDAFGNTPMYNAVNGVANCIILGKLEQIQSAVEFINQRAHISFPLLPNGTFALENIASGDAKAFLDDPVQIATAEMDLAVGKVLGLLYRSFIQEGLIAGCLLLVYLLVVLMGVGRAVWGSFTGINASKPGGFANSLVAAANANAADLAAPPPGRNGPDPESAASRWELGPDGQYAMRGSNSPSHYGGLPGPEVPGRAYHLDGNDGDHRNPFRDSVSLYRRQARPNAAYRDSDETLASTRNFEFADDMLDEKAGGRRA